MERGWDRRHPFHDLTTEAVEALVRPAFPDGRVRSIEPLTAGLRNTNYRVDLTRPGGSETCVVLRLYTADPAACRREAALARLVGDAVPMARVFHADPDADPPYAVTSWIDGVKLDNLLQDADDAAIESATYAAGSVLAAIHRFSFPGAGFLGPDLEIARPLQMGGEGWAAYVELFLFERGVAGKLGDDLTRRLAHLVTTHATLLDPLQDDRALVHADYKPWNLLVREQPGQPGAGWTLAGVLDWEFAFAGSPLVDLAIFLRQERQQPPAYARGFEAGYRDAGGRLPDDWRPLTKLLDLLNLCSMLDGPGLGGAFVEDARRIVAATLEDFGVT